LSQQQKTFQIRYLDCIFWQIPTALLTKTLDENISIANENIDYIEEICNTYLKNYNQTAKVVVANEFFNTRVYDDFTLPAGYYNTIKIEIGKGEGHNWWCIVFPSVCLSACSESMNDYLTDEEIELISSGYTPKFKIIEIYEKIKDRLEK
jgi:stage II sporulation protein R